MSSPPPATEHPTPRAGEDLDGKARSLARLVSKAACALLLIAILGGAFASTNAAAKEPRRMILATTTSVRDSGLLDALLPEFTETSGIHVQVIAVGTGAALRMGREGNADLLLTHAPASEQVLVDEGIVTRRTPFMENHFVIAGPSDDPAGVAEAASPTEAIEAIVRSGAAWVSRSDDSGTHKREVSLFRAAGLDPEASWPGLVRTGSGMGHSLQVAGERRAYVLSDIGTFLAFQERIDLVALSKESGSLRNVYSVLQLEPSKFDHAIRSEEGAALAAYLTAPVPQEKIATFGVERFGRPLFTPLLRPIPTPPVLIDPSGSTSG